MTTTTGSVVVGGFLPQLQLISTVRWAITLAMALSSWSHAPGTSETGAETPVRVQGQAIFCGQLNKEMAS